MSGFIYLITNTINNKKYVGQTVNSIEERYKGHICAANAGLQSILYSAMRKYGIINFRISLLEEVEGDFDVLDEREIFHISDQKAEYNMTKGGRGWRVSSHYYWVNNGEKSLRLKAGLELPAGFSFGILKATKLKISKANIGKVLTTETIKKIVAKTTGTTRTLETKEKQRLKALNRRHTLETRAEMSLSRKGRYVSEETKAKLASVAADGWAKRRAKTSSSSS